jgi:DNA-directed RNA polymerase specialized sigma24 family protein
MVMSDVYTFLYQVQVKDDEINRCIIQRDALVSCLMPAGMRYDKDKVQTSPDDQLGEIGARIADIDTYIRRLQREKAHAIIEISDAVNRLESKYEKLVLLRFYITGMSVRQIADMMHYSMRQVYYYKKQGAQNLLAILESQRNLSKISQSLVL